MALAASDAQRVAEQMLEIRELLVLRENDQEDRLAIDFFEMGRGINFRAAVGNFSRELEKLLDQKGINTAYQAVIVGKGDQAGLKNNIIEPLVQLLNKNPELLNFFHAQLEQGTLQAANAAYGEALEDDEARVSVADVKVDLKTATPEQARFRQVSDVKQHGPTKAVADAALFPMHSPMPLNAALALAEGILVIPEIIIKRVIAKADNKKNELKLNWDSLAHPQSYLTKKAKLAESQAEINYLLAVICYNELRILQHAIELADSEESRNNAILNMLRAAIFIAAQQKLLTAKELERAEQHLSMLQSKIKIKHPPVNLDVEITAEDLAQKRALLRAIDGTQGNKNEWLLLEAEINFYEAKLKLHATVERLSREQLVKDYNINVDKLLRQMLSIKELLRLPFLNEQDPEYQLAVYFFESGPGVKFKSAVGGFGVALKEILDKKGIFNEYKIAIIGSYDCRGLINGSKQRLNEFLNKYPELYVFFHDQLALNILQQANDAFCMVLRKGEPTLLDVWKATHPSVADSKAQKFAVGNVSQKKSWLTRESNRFVDIVSVKDVTYLDLTALNEDLKGSEAQLRSLSCTASVQLILRGGDSKTTVAKTMSASDYVASTKPLKVTGGVLSGNERTKSNPVTIAALQEKMVESSLSGHFVLITMAENFRLYLKRLEIKMLQARTLLFQEIFKGAKNKNTINILRLEAVQAKINYFSALAVYIRLQILEMANSEYLNMHVNELDVLNEKMKKLFALNSVKDESFLSLYQAVKGQVESFINEVLEKEYYDSDDQGLISNCVMRMRNADDDLKKCVKEMALIKPLAEGGKQMTDVNLSTPNALK